MSQIISLGGGGGGSGGVLTITGNIGTATPIAGNIIIETFEATCGNTAEIIAGSNVVSVNLEDSSNNIALGAFSGASFTGSQKNTALGSYSINTLNAGQNNTAVGYYSMSYLINGNSNTAIGYQSGYSYIGSESNNITIANLGNANDNGVIYIGTDPVVGGSQTTCYIAGIQGVNIQNNDGVPVYISTSNAQLGTITSSIKYKDNIRDMDSYSDSIMKLRPVVFNYKQHSASSISVGLIAEEVDTICPDLVIYKNNEPETIKYHNLPILLLNEIQKLRKEVDELKSRLA
jgi:hypothetical protein